MEEKLQHDPRTKQQIKDSLFSFLYEPIQKQLKNRLDTIIMKNSVLSGASHNSFMYKGEYFSCDPAIPPRKMNRLIPQLQPLMDDYLKEVKELNDTELPFVVGFITQVLNSSNDLHDYLRVLPSSVHRPIEQFISSCPCRTKKLSDDEIQSIQKKNIQSIELMKKRMVTNLLL